MKQSNSYTAPQEFLRCPFSAVLFETSSSSIFSGFGPVWDFFHCENVSTTWLCSCHVCQRQKRTQRISLLRLEGRREWLKTIVSANYHWSWCKSGMDQHSSMISMNLALKIDTQTNAQTLIWCQVIAPTRNNLMRSALWPSKEKQRDTTRQLFRKWITAGAYWSDTPQRWRHGHSQWIVWMNLSLWAAVSRNINAKTKTKHVGCWEAGKKASCFIVSEELPTPNPSFYSNNTKQAKAAISKSFEIDNMHFARIETFTSH